MAIPKMTLKVKLVKKDEVIFELLHITSIFPNNTRITTTSKWEFKRGVKFDIDFYNGIMTLPINPDINKDKMTIIFSNDGMRKLLLKDLNLTLLQWSSDMLFKSVKYFNKPHIKYSNKLWLIY